MNKLLKKKIVGDELVVSFIHANYFIRAAGTEQFVRDYSRILQKKGFNHLCFFGFFEKKSITGKKIVGVNLNDVFLGIFYYDEINNVIDKVIKDYKFKLRTIQIQHLLNQNLDSLSKVLLRYCVPVYIFVHDFFLVCCQYHLINSQCQFCGVSIPNEKKCFDCTYMKDGINHFKSIKKFICSINSIFKGFVVPSEYVANELVKVFPEYQMIIRPHLKCNGKKMYQPINGKIRVAFAGRMVESKGILEWENLVKKLYPRYKNNYEFFYLGVDDKQVSGVNNIKVSVAEQGKNAMINTLKKYGIDCALVWPRCAETYSYVYYEMSTNGVFIVSNQKSGNISSEIIKNKNGKVFENFQDCVEWFEKPEEVLSEINKFRKKPSFAPANIESNEEIIEVNELKGQSFYMEKAVKTPHKLFLQSECYRLKYYMKGIKL